ncbi:MAG TPA: hypothetical protein VIA06_05000 [Candidatus Dormibacteraeota bacterium]|nr:hypothetical protein [Candidatus Dormibacteraeota bacterium]
MFWTAEVRAAFEAHGSTEVHAAATPTFIELIASSDITIGETLMTQVWRSDPKGAPVAPIHARSTAG